MKLQLNHVAAVAGAMFALSSQAGIVSYSTWSAYNTATSGNATIAFDAQNNFYYGNSLTVGALTFTEANSRLFVLPGGLYNDPFTSNYLNNNGGSNQVGVAFDSAIYGFAMDFGTIVNWGGGALEITFNFDGGSETISLPGELYNGNAALSFIGFTSDTAFSSVTIGDPTSGLAIDNFTYTSAPAQGVPEPSTLALVGLALVGAARARKRH